MATSALVDGKMSDLKMSFRKLCQLPQRCRAWFGWAFGFAFFKYKAFLLFYF